MAKQSPNYCGEIASGKGQERPRNDIWEVIYLQTLVTCRLLPEREKFNLSSQIERAATSIVLNIAEGSTGQPNAEQNRFLGLALRSYLETIACCDVIERRAYIPKESLLPFREQGHQLFIKLSAFRKALK